MRLVAPWGFYGMGNTGDEGTLSGFARLMALSGIAADVSIGCGDPRHTARVEPGFRYFSASGRDPRRWWAKARGTAQAVIGGTPIMDVLGDWPLSELVPILRAADRRRVPFAFVGCGVENLREARSRDALRAEVIPRVHYWSVRSERDGNRLIDAGASQDRITIAADLAWLIEPASDERMNRQLDAHRIGPSARLIGVSVCNENRCLDRHPEMADALARALDCLISAHDAFAVFLCAEMRDEPEFDRAAADRIRARMAKADRTLILPRQYFTPKELMTVIGRCSLVFSMRYHVCLFSTIQSVPFIGLERSDKVSDLCWDLGWHSRVALPFDDAEGLIAMARDLLENHGAAQGKLRAGVSAMRERTLLNRAPLDALVRLGT